MKRTKTRYYVVASIAVVLAAVVFLLAPPRVAAMQPLPLTATSIALNPDDPNQQQVGRLRYMGGLVIKSTNDGFGGLSGLRAGPDNRLLAVSDTGNWVTFTTIERDGRLVGVSDGNITPILDGAGMPPADKEAGDAEALEWDPATGDAIVSFEQDHRLQFYRGIDPAKPDTLMQAATQVRRDPATAKWPDNAGGEALARLASGTLALLSEDAMDNYDRHDLLLITGNTTRRLGYVSPKGTRPTDAILLSGPDTILVVNRSYSPLGGVTAVLEILDIGALAKLPDSGVAGSAQKPVARLAKPLTVDNMEGIALRREGGRTFVYLVSDDNFNPMQRTILLKFELLPE
ncbi:esterase-like activity of phytase family protein [Polymorphobacter arshaanensis]|nr:esterase-like activity of phytase family protein [Polymorphobacter arshaanensis]